MKTKKMLPKQHKQILDIVNLAGKFKQLKNKRLLKVREEMEKNYKRF